MTTLKTKMGNLAIAVVGFGSVMAIANPSQAALLGSDNTPGYFDSSSGNRIITFSDDETITDLNVLVDFVKADGETFDPPYPTGVPFFNEIVFSLLAPDGVTSVDLISSGSFNSGAESTLFEGQIIFDQQATEVVNVNPDLPRPGTFRPVGDLSIFNGLSSVGNWTLSIRDTVGNDALRFRGFNIGINGPATVAVPTPALLPALIGMGAAAYRRRKGSAIAKA
ncbi:MAG: PTPA-CTERM sorting domain-containing protein [Alkalinema sp. RU_4_3]|nr:PTPA-CTERM sorting domain-containing protein [Alkalinema sp. RU_4_3]